MPDKSYPEMFDALPVERQNKLLNWIEDNLMPRKAFNERHTSYGMKQHIKLADDTDGSNSYFYDGEFKGAMLKLGYKVKDQSTLHWVFNVSEKSPLFKKHKQR